MLRSLWPSDAPASIKAVLVGLGFMVALALLNLVTALLVRSSGNPAVIESVIIAVLFVGLMVGVSRARGWARLIGIGVAALFAFSALGFFRPGIPGLFQVVGVLQLMVLVSVVVLLVARPSADWFRTPR